MGWAQAAAEAEVPGSRTDRSKADSEPMSVTQAHEWLCQEESGAGIDRKLPQESVAHQTGANLSADDARALGSETPVELLTLTQAHQLPSEQGQDIATEPDGLATSPSPRRTNEGSGASAPPRTQHTKWTHATPPACWLSIGRSN